MVAELERAEILRVAVLARFACENRDVSGLLECSIIMSSVLDRDHEELYAMLATTITRGVHFTLPH